MRHLPWIVACATMLFGGSPASACPLCLSETGRLVRAGIFNSDFGVNLLATLLPFPFFLAVVAWIYFGLPGRGEGPVRATSSEEGDPLQDRAG